MPAPPEGWERERAELQARVRLLEADCAHLADAQEEIAALGLVAEEIRATSDPGQVLQAGLERVGILRALPFCACAALQGEEAEVLAHYGDHGEAPLPRIRISARVAAALREGRCLLEGAACAEGGLDGRAPVGLRPAALLLLPFRSRDWPSGVFLFASEREGGELEAMTPLLSRVVEALVARLDNVALVRDLQALNARLDEKVKERTRELLAQIQERQRAEEALRQSQKTESLGRLAGGVAHDFNNALTTVLGLADVLLADAAPGTPLAADLKSIRDAGRHAASLTRQLLAFSRKQKLEMVPLQLDEHVRAFAGMLGRVLGEDVALRLQLEAGAARVRADRSQLEQVLMNLAVNAREAMPAGGTLTLASALLRLGPGTPEVPDGLQPGEYLRLSVSDTGQGMGPEVLSRAFDPYFTTKEKGTGLGLSTVYGIVRQHGGQVAVASQPGQGTRFDVWLPRAAEGVLDRPLALTPVPQLLGGTETVLVVDDDASVRTIAARLLGREGYRVLHAADAAEALRLLSEDGKVEALLTDVVMPGMRGQDLARAFLERHPACPVLYMSGYSEDLALRGDGPLGDGFVPKPLVPVVLLSALRRALDRARASRDPAALRPPRPGAA